MQMTNVNMLLFILCAWCAVVMASRGEELRQPPPWHYYPNPRDGDIYLTGEGLPSGGGGGGCAQGFRLPPNNDWSSGCIPNDFGDDTEKEAIEKNDFRDNKKELQDNAETHINDPTVKMDDAPKTDEPLSCLPEWSEMETPFRICLTFSSKQLALIIVALAMMANLFIAFRMR